MPALRIFLSLPGDLAEEHEIARDVIEQLAVRGRVTNLMATRTCFSSQL